ncbi:MAG TPA: hypothetical protein VHP37_19820 [Burkholderiales bacterium]|nr:hypothetical protein [Burkholderiales bacterium]
MNDPRKSYEAFCERALPRLRRYLLRHFRPLSADHEDILQDALADLFAFVQRRNDVLSQDDELMALAYAITKRRAADRYRGAVRRAASELNAASTIAEVEEHDVRFRYRELLSAVLLLLTDLSESDQQLLLREQLSSGDKLEALTPAERKRLSRLRQMLRERLRARFGSDPYEYLGG